MQLNPDCLRAVLLYAEAHAEFDSPWNVPIDGVSSISEFPAREIRHHVDQCVAAGYFIKGEEWITGDLEILGLSPSGHQAIATIRSPAIHEKAKGEWLSKVRDGLISASTSQFVALAAGILKSHLLS